MNDFFTEVSKESKVASTEMIKIVYFDIVKIIYRMIAEGKNVKLPQLGKFEIVEYAPKLNPSVEEGTGNIIMIQLPKRNVVKFTMPRAVRKRMSILVN